MWVLQQIDTEWAAHTVRGVSSSYSGQCVFPPERRIRTGNYVTAGQPGHWLCELNKA